MTSPEPPPPAVSLLDHLTVRLQELEARFSVRLGEKDLRDQQRYDAQTKAVETAMVAVDTAMKAAMTAAEKAGDKAMAASEKAIATARISDDKRFELLNELRVGVATKDEVSALEKLVNATREDIVGLRQRGAGVSSSLATMLGVGGLILTLVAVAVAVIVATR